MSHRSAQSFRPRVDRYRLGFQDVQLWTFLIAMGLRGFNSIGLLLGVKKMTLLGVCDFTKLAKVIINT